VGTILLCPLLSQMTQHSLEDENKSRFQPPAIGVIYRKLVLNLMICSLAYSTPQEIAIGELPALSISM